MAPPLPQQRDSQESESYQRENKCLGELQRGQGGLLHSFQNIPWEAKGNASSLCRGFNLASTGAHSWPTAPARAEAPENQLRSPGAPVHATLSSPAPLGLPLISARLPWGMRPPGRTSQAAGGWDKGELPLERHRPP